MIAIKGSEFSLSNGDNPGVAGGVKSNTFMKESTWILYSFDVKMDGKNACRLTDKKFQNHQNTVDLAGAITKPTNLSPEDSQLFDDCVKQHDKYKATEKKFADTKTQTFKDLKDKLYNNRYTQQNVDDYCGILKERIKIADQVYDERKEYVDMDCDKFDYYNKGTTPSERKAAHSGALEQLKKNIENMKAELVAWVKP